MIRDRMTNATKSSQDSASVGHDIATQRELLAIQYVFEEKERPLPTPVPLISDFQASQDQFHVADMLAILISLHTHCDEATVLLELAHERTRVLVLADPPPNDSVCQAINTCIHHWWKLSALERQDSHSTDNSCRDLSDRKNDLEEDVVLDVFKFAIDKGLNRINEGYPPQDGDMPIMNLLAFRDALCELAPGTPTKVR